MQLYGRAGNHIYFMVEQTLEFVPYADVIKAINPAVEIYEYINAAVLVVIAACKRAEQGQFG